MNQSIATVLNTEEMRCKRRKT